MLKKLGPGVLVAAAFIGPGTVTVCTLAGVGFGYALLWALLLSMVATVVLQEMSARVGIVTGKGLASILREELTNKVLRYIVLGIVLLAVVLGNAAYEAGNIAGASLGLEAAFGKNLVPYYPWAVGILAGLLLFQGNYKVLERVFVSLVMLMSISFLVTAVLTRPDIISIGKGLLLPSLPGDSLLTVIALVGTTVVPYNLFLHASLATEKWKSPSDLNLARLDTLLAIGLGGLVSMTIVISAAAIPTETVSSAFDLAGGLEPFYGKWARYFMGIGLFAAGITSSITAPLAAAYVVSNCFGWNAGLSDGRFRLVWAAILLVGMLSMSLGIQPIEIIRLAQIANGLLLPLIAIFLLWAANRSAVLGKYRNNLGQNFFAILVIGLVAYLGIRSILKVLEQWL